MKYGVVVFPAKSLQDFANSYRKRYDPNYAKIPPHITLKAEFQVHDDEINGIVRILHELANNARPFNIKMTKFSSFQPVNNVIYLKIDPNTELEKLHKEISSRFPEHVPEYVYAPHITIAQNLSNEEHSDVYGTLKMRRVNMQDKIDHFHLLYQLENGSWTVYETFRFGKEA